VSVFAALLLHGCFGGHSFVSCVALVGGAACKQKALDLLGAIKAKNLEPNEITYNVVMGACGAAGRWKEALNLFYQMQAAGLPPDAVTFGKS
jgi:pentatricopeptide repeat protein